MRRHSSGSGNRDVLRPPLACPLDVSRKVPKAPAGRIVTLSGSRCTEATMTAALSRHRAWCRWRARAQQTGRTQRGSAQTRP
eukprot:5890378-Prymnesium_polylepis.1